MPRWQRTTHTSATAMGSVDERRLRLPGSARDGRDRIPRGRQDHARESVAHEGHAWRHRRRRQRARHGRNRRRAPRGARRSARRDRRRLRVLCHPGRARARPRPARIFTVSSQADPDRDLRSRVARRGAPRDPGRHRARHHLSRRCRHRRRRCPCRERPRRARSRDRASRLRRRGGPLSQRRGRCRGARGPCWRSQRTTARR